MNKTKIRILTLLFTFISCTFLTSCLGLLSALLETDNNKTSSNYSSYYKNEKVQTWTIKESGDVYLVKYNTSNEAVKGVYTGYVKDTKRNAEVEELNETTEPPIISLKRNPDYFYNDNEDINKMNAEYIKSLSKDFNSRSSRGTVESINNQNNNTIEKGDKKYFYLINDKSSSNPSRKIGECVKVGKYCNILSI